MNRRTVLRCLSITAMGLLARGIPHVHAAAGTLAVPTIPILMFHKVDDQPRYPEDIPTQQLNAVLGYAWKSGYHPVNMSDIILGRVDSIVPKGLKPLGITADDSHRSLLFSQSTVQHEEQRNARSFMDIFSQSLKDFGYKPRATFFLSRVGDDRYSKKAEEYFGGSQTLTDVLDTLATTPGVELGYHTASHTLMKNMGPEQVRALLQEQMDDFQRLGVLHRMARILAYPYGVTPTKEGISELAALGFIGAVLAFPGVGEASYTDVQRCNYDARLLTDPFLIPRVCIGAFTYAPKVVAKGGAYVPIEPLDDFCKDVEAAQPNIYVSKGPRAFA